MLTRYEQETIINFNAETREVSICTADPVQIRRLDRLVEEFPNHYKYVKSEYCKGEEVYRYYSTTKKMLSYRKPVIISEDRKEKLRLQLQNARDKKN